MPYTQSKPIPVAKPSKAWVSGRLLSGIVSLNLAEACMYLMSVVCCVGRGSLD